MAKENRRKWKLGDAWTLLRNASVAILKGDLLLRINAGKYLIHIAYTFLLCWILIFESLMAENAQVKVEAGKRKLSELEIIYADKTFEVASMSRRSEVEKRLKEMGSSVTEPTKQAIRLD